MSVRSEIEKVLRKSKYLYQTYTIKDKVILPGIRGIERRNFIDVADIKGKNILDLGCATGAECIWSLEKGANRACGVDSVKENIEIFNEIISILKWNNKAIGVEFDLNNNLPCSISSDDFDTVFCFAITQYIKYRKVWHEVVNAKVVYVEGGGDSTYTESMLTDNLFKATKIGMTPGNSSDMRLIRPLFRLERK
jgi:2-polyprenyl-3-methyl-5-hydroxy-6-metoxy-1,4-benzoquinol methylase